ncbi:hypothetical protein EVB79_027 [Rhizobium phage RHph_N3_13]|nr:hypothetical protein EVB79_027 [Rhizobium phage RHph_N3_13]QIG69855.1 hypothetical protein F67_I3_11_029 [Rhizobium phage RHph_I3_11]
MEPSISDGWVTVTSASELQPGMKFAQAFHGKWNYGVIISEEEWRETNSFIPHARNNDGVILGQWKEFGKSWNDFSYGEVRIQNLVFKYDPSQAGDTEDDI